jgi:hypothetical protein
MSLRKSPQVTPELLAATRQNAQHSTGPRTAAAKQNSKFNALKHGAYVRDENHHAAMRALGEDPEQFQALVEELLRAFGPGDALWEMQIEDLARLYWRRDRLERMQEGLKRRALQGIDDWQHRRRQEMARVTFSPTQPHILDVSLSESNDRGVELRKTLSYLELVREQTRRSIFSPRQGSILESLYKGKVGWRMALVLNLLWHFHEMAKVAKHPAQNSYLSFLREQGDEPPGESDRQDLLRLLEEEITSVREEFAYAEKLNAERTEIEREACLVPEGETWNMLLRQEGALDRSIDRKVRILLRLRKEATDRPVAPTVQDESASVEEPAESDSAWLNSPGVASPENTKLTERSGNVYENEEECRIMNGEL